MNRHLGTCVFLIASFGFSHTALADETNTTSVSASATTETQAPPPTTDEPKEAKTSALFGARIGGLAPFSGLSPFVTVGLEAGVILPFAKRAFALALDVDYTAPKNSGSETDARVPGGAYDWKLTEQQLVFMPAAFYRVNGLGKVTPYVGIGPRFYLLQSTVRGSSGGATINETTERSTKVGVGLPLGAEFALGPGALTAELLLQYGPLDHRATGDSNTGAANLFLGYRFIVPR